MESEASASGKAFGLGAEASACARARAAPRETRRPRARGGESARHEASHHRAATATAFVTADFAPPARDRTPGRRRDADDRVIAERAMPPRAKEREDEASTQASLSTPQSVSVYSSPPPVYRPYSE